MNFFGFFVVMSASQSVIKSSIFSPASYTNLLTAASVILLPEIAIGLELRKTNF